MITCQFDLMRKNIYTSCIKKIYTTLHFADQNKFFIKDSEIAAYVKHITYTNSSGALLTQGPLFWFVQQRRLSFVYRTYELTQGSLATCS